MHSEQVHPVLLLPCNLILIQFPCQTFLSFAVHVFRVHRIEETVLSLIEVVFEGALESVAI